MYCYGTFLEYGKKISLRPDARTSCGHQLAKGDLIHHEGCVETSYTYVYLTHLSALVVVNSTSFSRGDRNGKNSLWVSSGRHIIVLLILRYFDIVFEGKKLDSMCS